MTIWIGVMLGVMVFLLRWYRGKSTRQELWVMAGVLLIFVLVQFLLCIDTGRWLPFDRRYQEPNVVPLLVFSGVPLAALAQRGRHWKRLLVACVVALTLRATYRAHVMHAPDRLNAYILESSRWAASVIQKDRPRVRYERVYSPLEYLSFTTPTIASPSPLVSRLVKGRWLGCCVPPKRNSGYAFDLIPFFAGWEKPDYICSDVEGLDLSREYVLLSARKFSRLKMSVFRRRNLQRDLN